MKTIKRNSTNELNVSQRTVTYDCYLDDTYVTTFKDICDAVVWRDAPTKEVKRNSTNEVNVSQRHIWYDCYLNGEFVTKFDDVCDAVAWRDAK